MFALIFAFVNFGLLLFRWCTLQNAVREGCRYAITFQTSGANSQDTSVELIVQQYAMGIVKITGSPQQIFVKYCTPANLNSAIPIEDGGNIPGNVVEVSAQRFGFAKIGAAGRDKR